MIINKIQPVILAGGSGTRLWPLSRKMYPKQFLALDSSANSLLQNTVKRIDSLDKLPPIVICNEEHRFIVAEQLRQIGCDNAKIILEPVGKNTAPAIALASLLANQLYTEDDITLLILSADHVIKNQEAFEQSINKARALAINNKLVTFGIIPTKAETGYGYIQKGQSLTNGFEVGRFVEKPNLATAEEYLASHNYLWNSGMFMFKPSCYLEALKTYSSNIYEYCAKSVATIEHDMDFIRVDKQIFQDCPNDSIDYAVMEKADNVAMVELDAGWSDIGSWDAVWENLAKDDANNVLIGDVINHDSHNSYVYSDEKLVSIVGVDNLVVIDTKDALLVADKNNSQAIKTVVETLQKSSRSEHLNHRVVQRPWGCYDSIDNGERYQVKRITVKPGAKLSVQMHYHRAEHWIVVSGTALITNGDKSFMLSENQSTYIPAGVVHALENPGKIPLEIIEVQSGAYLGEDDIVRFEDKYGRLNP